MAGDLREFIFYGDDIKLERFPENTRFLYANPPMPPVADPTVEIDQALVNPVEAEPLEKQLNTRSRVTIAFDDPCLPLPLMRTDTRGMIIERLLFRLQRIGVQQKNIRLICANGLHRKWTPAELAQILGKRIMQEIGSQVVCHDATRDDELVDLGTTAAGMTVEVNRALAESDITIYVNLNFTTMNGGWKSVTVGLGSWRSIRHHHNPDVWNGQASVLDPEQSGMHKALWEMGARIKEKFNVFQIESVINNHFWPPPLDRWLAYNNTGRRQEPPGMILKAALGAAAGSPAAVKQALRRRLRGNYQLLAVNAGEVEAVHRRTVDLLFSQQNIRVNQQADILIFGIPNLSPYSAFSIMNPILLRGLVLGYYLGMYRGRPLLKKGGVIVACNPGIDQFHPRHHPSYQYFWNHDLKHHQEPVACWNNLAERYARAPEFLKKYRNDYAYHGTHVLINWFWSGLAMNYVGKVILAGARQPRTAEKIGFTPAKNLTVALGMAREIAGKDARIVYQAIPPLFACDPA